jgi:hypothetical protein
VTAIESVLWPGMKRLEPTSKLGGVLARKPGYHNSRDHLPPDDYSVRFPADKLGPADEGSAIDWTFPDAQRGDYSTIKVYSRHLLNAGKNRDPRTQYFREFFGNADDDREVEGWDFTKGQPSTSDTSHLWHIHLSVHRKWINSVEAMRAMLSILGGEPLALYEQRQKRTVVMVDISGRLPALQYGDKDPVNASGTSWIKRAQRQLEVGVDGWYASETALAVKNMMAADDDRTSTDGRKIGLPEWRRLYGIW